MCTVACNDEDIPTGMPQLIWVLTLSSNMQCLSFAIIKSGISIQKCLH